MKMFSYRSSLVCGWKVSAALIVVLGMGVLVPGAMAGAKKKAPVNTGPVKPTSQRKTLDISKLVYPSPPAIARVKFVDQYTGEKIDLKALSGKQKKPKQSWMDRMAGTDPQKESVVKIPFQLIRTYGVAADSKGKIYAADQAVGAIFVFNPETKDVELIANGKNAHFGLITGMAIDDSDRVFVADAKFHQVIVLNSKHQQEAVFGADVLIAPAGLAIDTENRFLYVVDTQRDQVVVYDADSYKLLRYIGTSGKKHVLKDAGNFALPVGVAVDKDRNVYVTDTLNCRVEIFDAEGKFVSEFGKNGDGPADFARPKGITIDSDGHIWVIDAVQSKIKVFNTEGRLLLAFSEPGGNPTQLSDPWGLAADGNNHIITSEQYPGRVQVFRYVTDAEAEAERQKKEAATKPATTTAATTSAPAATTTTTAATPTATAATTTAVKKDDSAPAAKAEPAAK
jgi:sugar lactone lactonase YvrE